jgi:hypothetical protein
MLSVAPSQQIQMMLHMHQVLGQKPNRKASPVRLDQAQAALFQTRLLHHKAARLLHLSCEFDQGAALGAQRRRLQKPPAPRILRLPRLRQQNLSNSRHPLRQFRQRPLGTVQSPNRPFGLDQRRLKSPRQWIRLPSQCAP